MAFNCEVILCGKAGVPLGWCQPMTPLKISDTGGLLVSLWTNLVVLECNDERRCCD